MPAAALKDGPVGEALINGPEDLELWHDPESGEDVIYVADAFNARVQVFRYVEDAT